jgi:hypothetical protein
MSANVSCKKARNLISIQETNKCKHNIFRFNSLLFNSATGFIHVSDLMMANTESQNMSTAKIHSDTAVIYTAVLGR